MPGVPHGPSSLHPMLAALAGQLCGTCMAFPSGRASRRSEEAVVEGETFRMSVGLEIRGDAEEAEGRLLCLQDGSARSLGVRVV